MNVLRPNDIFCDPPSEEKMSVCRTITLSPEATNRPIKLRKIQRPPIDGKTNARRNLFGPVDHNSTDKFLKKQLDILSDLSNRKWNFDFSKEKPLRGTWQWERVGPHDPEVPVAYRGILHVEDEEKLIFQAREVEKSSDVQSPAVLGLSPGNVRVPVTSKNTTSQKTNSFPFRPSKSRKIKREQSATQPCLKGYLQVKKRKSNQISPEKIQRRRLDEKSSSTLLHLVKTSVSPSKTTFSSQDTIA